MTTAADTGPAHTRTSTPRAPLTLERATLSLLSECIVDELATETLLARLCEVLVEAGDVAGACISCALPDGSVVLRSAHPEEFTELVSSQFALREGPCYDCWSSAEPVFEDGLPGGAARRWPAWAADLRGLLPPDATALRSDPIVTRGGGMGSLCVVGSAKAVRSSSSANIRRLVQVAATHALTTHSHDHFKDLAGQLQHALETRVRIEQAKGALATHYGITVDAAFARLRQLARDQGRRLHEVAAEVVQELGDRARDASDVTVDGRHDATPPLRIIGTARGLRLVGAADISAVPLLTSALQQLDGAADTVIDLTDLAFLDAQCAHTILQCGRQRRAVGARLTLAGARPVVGQVLALLGAADLPGVRVVARR